MNSQTIIGKSSEKPLSPSDLNSMAKETIESQIARIWVSGEISDLYQAPSGHAYFSLKDSQSSIKCTFFKQFNFAKTKLVNGDQVLIMGLATLYSERGTFQIKVERVLKSGKGSMALAFEELKAKLESLGYFDAKNKTALPQVIENLGIVTSKSSAAIRDVLDVIKRRNPLLNITIYNSSVQGDHAVEEIINALHQADIGNHDVILLTRGGGSEEDLWTFNDISIAQTLFNLSTPTISAIGHERDTSICDLVADEFAITPSAAAEQLTPDLSQLKQKLLYSFQTMRRSILQKLENQYQKIDNSYLKLEKTHPKIKLQQQQQDLYQKSMQLNNCIKNKLSESNNIIERYHSKISSQDLNLIRTQSDLEKTFERMKFFMHNQINSANNKVQNNASKLQTLSPLSTLSRGFSITKDNTNRVIDDINKIKIGEKISTRIKTGEIISTVDSVKNA